jgi:hypothetical protein
MKEKQETTELSKRELKIASLMIDHFYNKLDNASAVQEHFETVEEIKNILPSRLASIKTINAIADKSDFFKINTNGISLASSEIDTNVTYTITGATNLTVNGENWSIDGGTRSIKLKIPEYKFEVMADTSTPLGDWKFTASKIKTVLGQTRRQIGDGKGRGNSSITIYTTA